MIISPINQTHFEEIAPFDASGPIIYIFGVLIWYALGFGLILIDDINPQSGRNASHKHVSVHQTVSDLHEQEDRNDILVELKDKNRRMKLWQIYYGTKKNHPVTIKKDEQAVELIIKQLNELNDRRRELREALNEIRIDQTDEDENYSIDDRNNRSTDLFKSYFK